MGSVTDMDVGPAELIIVLVIALVLFGGKKLPELARSLGQAKNEFEKGVKGAPEDSPTVTEPTAAAPATVPMEVAGEATAEGAPEQPTDAS